MGAEKRVWLIGLDGASFDIFEPLFEAGKLPVLKKIIDTGASGVLKSTLVPFTPQAWGSVITGNNPGKHGVFGFVRQMPGRPPEFLNSRALKGDKLWALLGRKGLRSVIVNVPLTYPPDPVNGAMVTGMMTPSTASDFTYPVELKERVLSRWPEYRLDVTSSIDRSRNLGFLDELEEAMHMNLELTLDLSAGYSPHFLFKVFVLPDRVQHAYGHLIHPSSTAYESPAALRWRDRLYRSYMELDKAIGRLVESAPPDTDILFVSDHGFSTERGGFFTNDFLAGLGLLEFKPGADPRKGTAGAVRAVARRLNMQKVKKFIPNQTLKQTADKTKDAIDWSRTSAYSSPPPQQGIFINTKNRGSRGIVEEDEYEELRDRIIAAISALVDPATSAPAARAYRREDVFSGPYLESIPDIVLDFSSSSLEAKDVILGGDALSWSDGGSRGIHHRDGFFAACGPGVNPGSYEDLTLEDIAPNILSLFGLSGHEPMDGRVRKDIFKV